MARNIQLVVVAIIISTVVAAFARPSTKSRVTSVTSSARSTRRTNSRNDASTNDPHKLYLRSIAWMSLANVHANTFEISAANFSANYYDQTKTLFTSNQLRLLQKNDRYTALIHAVSAAAAMTRTQCQMQFQHERWGCPSTGHVQLGNFRNASFYGRLMEYTTRQTAFLTALSSAALMSAILSASNRNDLRDICPCDSRFRSGIVMPSQLPEQWAARAERSTVEWGSCSDNVAQAEEIVEEFMSKPTAGNDLRFLANAHNRKVGINLVKLSVKTQCHCVNLFDGCKKIECYKRHEPLSKLAAQLKTMYEEAVSVNVFPGEQATLLDHATRRAPSPVKLVYTDETGDEDFCNANAKFGTPGTKKRTCIPDNLLQPTDSVKKGCDYLCCGRGFDSNAQMRQLPDQILLGPNDGVTIIPGKFEYYVRHQCR